MYYVHNILYNIQLVLRKEAFPDTWLCFLTVCKVTVNVHMPCQCQLFWIIKNIDLQQWSQILTNVQCEGHRLWWYSWCLKNLVYWRLFDCSRKLGQKWILYLFIFFLGGIGRFVNGYIISNIHVLIINSVIPSSEMSSH